MARKRRNRNSRVARRIRSQDQSLWLTKTWDVVIGKLTGVSSDRLWLCDFKDTGLAGHWAASGEFQFIEIRATFSPVAAQEVDRVSVYPWVADSQRPTAVADFVLSGYPIRPASRTFTATTGQSIVYRSEGVIPGGVGVYYHQDDQQTGRPSSSFGLIAVYVTYRERYCQHADTISEAKAI